MALRWFSSLALGMLVAACSGDHDGSVDANNGGIPRQYTGIWLYEFEGSTFLEGVSEVPKERPSYERTAWLNYHPEQQHSGQFVELSSFDAYDETDGCYPVAPFLVTFIGRKTTSRHGSGHLGLWDSEFSVDKMISAKPLGSPFCYGS